MRTPPRRPAVDLLESRRLLSVAAPVILSTATTDNFTGESSVADDSPFEFAVDFTGVDPGEAHRVTVDFGDGEVQTLQTNTFRVAPIPGSDDPTARRARFDHIYPQPGDYPITVVVEDLDAGLSDEESLSIAASNRAPLIGLEEGTWAEEIPDFLAVRLDDNRWIDTELLVTVDFGDGTDPYVATSVASGSYDNNYGHFPVGTLHEYANSGTYTRTITATDGRGLTRTQIDEVEVIERAPRLKKHDASDYRVLEFAGTNNAGEEIDYRTYEGRDVVLRTRVEDPGADETFVDVDWGDGTVERFDLGDVDGTAGTPVEFRHTYADIDGYTRGHLVTVTAGNADGGPSDTESRTLYVYSNAVYPYAYIEEDEVQAGDSFVVTVEADDYDNVGDYPVGGTLDFGDGRVESFAFTHAGQVLSFDHAYAQPNPDGSGYYQLRADSLDADGDAEYDHAYIDVTPAPEPPAPPIAVEYDPATGVLTVTGTEGDDAVALAPTATAGGVAVAGVGEFENVSRVVADLLGGDDDLLADADLAVAIDADGGAGDDSLVGGAGHDTLSGGAGVDVLDGAGGFYDMLYGGGGDDLLRDADGVRDARGNAGDDVIDLAFAPDWVKHPLLPLRLSPGGIQGNLGDDTVRVHVRDGGAPLTVVLLGDNVVRAPAPTAATP